jgi:DNA-binding NarL/FixJ family response regulator
VSDASDSIAAKDPPSEIGAEGAPGVFTRFRILFVHSHDLAYHGFRALLSREPWVEQLENARTSAEALEIIRRSRAHVAVVDTDLVRESAAELCDNIRRVSPSTRVLLIAGRRMSETQARAHGAAGVVPKTWDGRDIVGATRAVALGRNLYAPESTQPAELLSRRERAVLEMLAQGATNREIAAELSLSEHTIKDHLSGVYRKLNARNRADAVVRAQHLGVLG